MNAIIHDFKPIAPDRDRERLEATLERTQAKLSKALKEIRALKRQVKAEQRHASEIVAMSGRMVRAIYSRPAEFARSLMEGDCHCAPGRSELF